MNKKIWFSVILSLLFFSCSGNVEDSINSEDKNTENQELALNKPKILWFDAEANFKRFEKKDSIMFYLDKTKAAGFNGIVVDVRPIYGDVLYAKTTLMKPLTHIGDVTVDRDWDYLQFFIDEARKRDLSVTVSTCTFAGGRPATQEGPVYRSAKWNGKTAIQYSPDGMADAKDDVSNVAAFLNPALPQVQDYVLGFINEIVSNYDIDGFALDYCRFSGIESDFSEASKLAFEEYIGEKVPNFPYDILRWEGANPVYGKYARKWFEFRAMVIHDFVRKTKNTIKNINPDIELTYWAASWYNALFTKGQNWGSKNYDPSVSHPSWASAGYKNAGFAEHLDYFMNGAYLPFVYGLNNPESIEYGFARGKKIIGDACKMYGSIYAENHETIEDATYLCLKDTRGLVVFDIVQVINYDLWDDIERAISKYNEEIEEK